MIGVRGLDWTFRFWELFVLYVALAVACDIGVRLCKRFPDERDDAVDKLQDLLGQVSLVSWVYAYPCFLAVIVFGVHDNWPRIF